jgi:hypothetical protein
MRSTVLVPRRDTQGNLIGLEPNPSLTASTRTLRGISIPQACPT